MKRKSNKKLTIALLALLGVVSTAGTYAYWQGRVIGASVDKTNNTITIGSGIDVNTKITLNDPQNQTVGVLVPSAYKSDTYPAGVTVVSEISYEYTVTWVVDGESATDKGAEYEGTLVASLKSVTVAGLSESTASGDDKTAAVDLIKVTITYPDEKGNKISFKDNAAVLKPTVKVSVTLEEPDNKAQYDLIANKTITIELTFTVEANGLV